MRNWYCFCLFSYSFLFAQESSFPSICPIESLNQAQEITIDLSNPTYKNGVLFTQQGGVIKAPDMRFQARSIQYIHRNDSGTLIHRIEAEGDLMIQFHNRVFVGNKLEFDFVTKTGCVSNAKTFAAFGYVGSDQIQLLEDGSFHARNASFTTSENSESVWDIRAENLNVRSDLLEAQKIRFRIGKVPVMWLPSFKVNLKTFRGPLFRSIIRWDKGGPYVSVRYQIYSWRDWAFYTRLGYRLSTGFSGAFETEYLPPSGRMTCVSRSYLGTDTLENALEKEWRYRLQGAIHAHSMDQKTQTTLTWDKYNDVRMPSDFTSDDFELNTAKRTILLINHKETSSLTSFKVRPRVNTFESIKQDLPTLFFSIHPVLIKTTGMFFNFWGKASYLDFVYSDQLSHELPSMCSSRFEARPLIYRPLHLGSLNITPYFGGVAIFYGSSQTQHSRALGCLLYGGSASMTGKKTYNHLLHESQPYLDYFGISHPSVSPDSHYIFSIQDGFNRINKLQIGWRNNYYFSTPISTGNNSKAAFRKLSTDVYANAFFEEHTIHRTIPKLYLLVGWSDPSLSLTFHNAWNFWHQVLDFSNSRFQVTVNEDVAFALDVRYRSRYDWRKSDHENFILDVTRPECEMLDSPLSDQRISLLTHAFFRLTPFWECHIQSHHGFLRKTQDDEPPRNHLYNEVKIDLFTNLSANWKIRISYSHTINDDRVDAGFSLIRF